MRAGRDDCRDGMIFISHFYVNFYTGMFFRSTTWDVVFKSRQKLKYGEYFEK